MTYILILSLFFFNACETKQSEEANETVEINTMLETNDTVEVNKKPIHLSPYEEPPRENLSLEEEIKVEEEVVVKEEVQNIEENVSIEVEENQTVEHSISKSDIENKNVDKEWYIRIVVEDISNHLKTYSAQLGELDNAHDMHVFNLKALKPFSGNYVDVVFKNPVGMKAGEYKSDFHLLGTEDDTWNFTVKADDSNATMILGFRGLFVLSPYTDTEGRERYTEYRMNNHFLLSQMVLVDVLEDKEIPMFLNAEINEYLFSMNGVKEKDFKWKLKASLANNSMPLTRSLPSSRSQYIHKLQIKALRQDAKSKHIKDKKGNFDDLPPKFEVLVK